MKQPPTIQPSSRQGPDYDPMDRLVEDLQNIEVFLSKLNDNPQDLAYLNSHLSHILPLRRSISQQIDLLLDDPYNYPHDRLTRLHKENEKIFLHLEGLVGAMQAQNTPHFKKFMHALDVLLSEFDKTLTP